MNTETRRRAVVLVRVARQAGIPLVITSSLRTRAEQARLVAAGLSRTMDSAHLVGDAFDVDLYRVSRDRVPLSVWWRLGPYAEQYLGLIWGGRFSTLKDYGHFERS